MECSDVDRFFAATLLSKVSDGSEENAEFLAKLLAWSRLGHLCLQSNEKGALTLPSALVDTTDDPWPSKPIKRQGNTFYLQKNWAFETRFLTHVRRLLSLPGIEILDLQEESATDEQKAAIRNAQSLPFSVISGGPGTGKTFTASRIVQAFLKRDPEARILLAAPTGKAARQLKRNLSFEKKAQISTLHALFGLHKESNFMEEPSPLMADLLLVDECSMIDARLFSYLLASVGKETHLVLIGDPHQLPAVDSGSLFADLVDVLKYDFPKHLTHLTKSLRSDRPEILDIIQAIEEGKLSQKAFSPLGSQEEILQVVEPYFFAPTPRELDPGALFSKQSHFCLLSCLRKGPFGADALNALLAERFLNRMRLGDRLAMPILITRTDEDLDLYNGEIGTLVRSHEEEEWALFGPAPYKKVKAHLLPSYEYAYCLSVHKSQGSEYENVMLLVPPGSENFGREIVYTGATRAKKSLKILADPDTLQHLLLRASRKISALHARLRS